MLSLPKTKRAYWAVPRRLKPHASAYESHKNVCELFCYQGLLTEPEMRKETLKAMQLVWSLDFWPQCSLSSPDRQMHASPPRMASVSAPAAGTGEGPGDMGALRVRWWVQGEQKQHGHERTI